MSYQFAWREELIFHFWGGHWMLWCHGKRVCPSPQCSSGSSMINYTKTKGETGKKCFINFYVIPIKVLLIT